MLAATYLAHFHDAGDFLTETHTPRAMDAPRHVSRDQRTQILVFNDAFDFLIARGTAAISYSKIL
ncbi:hypothetical protein GALL_506040 [mine drainage metagenome]|uniref:Uncharacterized protein n=1 Tax=mine drainage metagenome TaxID=410659 RepID=A0A1J5P980_9ZZZZ